MPCKPELLWPRFYKIGNAVQEKDEKSFPFNQQGNNVNANIFHNYLNEHEMPLGSNCFWEKFRMSQDVLFEDKYFGIQEYKRMYYELEKILNTRDCMNKTIKIYCDEYRKLVEKYDANMKKKNGKFFSVFKVYVFPIAFAAQIHDRFAIMDREIWHCGAAIGGMKGELSAISRGWIDEDDRLRRFFEGDEPGYEYDR